MAGLFRVRSNPGFLQQNNTSGALAISLAIFGGHRMALGWLWSACKLLFYCRTTITPQPKYVTKLPHPTLLYKTIP